MCCASPKNGAIVNGTAVTIKGRVVKPLAAKQAPVVFKRQTSCTSYVTVGSGKVARSGAFRCGHRHALDARAAADHGLARLGARAAFRLLDPVCERVSHRHS